MPSRAVRDLRIGGRLFRKKGPPVSLIFFVTSRCNLSCTHCFYWEELNKKKKELSLQEIEKISLSLPNLLSLSLTGGEPYLRKDLPEIAALFEKNSNVRNIQVPSNGLLVEQTVSRAEALLQNVQRARVCTGVSLDGPQEIHNRIRQNSNSFQEAVETLKGLKRLKPRYPNLSVGIALTVSAANQNVLSEFFRYLAEKLEPDAITVTLTRGNPMDPSLKEVDIEIYRSFAEQVIRYRADNPRFDSWIEHLVIAKEEETYRFIAAAAAAQERISPCHAGELIGILSEVGEVYLCETLQQSMGNVRDFDGDFSRLWVSAQAEAARRYQNELQCQCTYECAMSVNTLFRPLRAARIVARAAARRTMGSRYSGSRTSREGTRS
jgi:sulfatase maturation enzyme AslB (radical SAM superfamily)